MLPHWTEGDVLVEGSRLHYYRTGSGSKPALVLAHGYSDNGLCWLPVARDLEAEFDVILADARGHGQSQRVQPDEMLDQPGDLAALMRGLGLNRAVVGGHSMGGSTAGEFGARYPELTRALILEDPAWFLPKEPAPEESVEAPKRGESDYDRWLKRASQLPMDTIMEKCRADSPNWPEVEIKPWAVSKQQFDPNFLSTRHERRDWRDAAARIQCPTLLITAGPERGAIITPELAKMAVSLNPLIQVAHVPDAGHNIRRDNYKAYIDAVCAFLHSLP
jgi:pimeloyl-ACP methyl ester carboxylesterase